MRFILFCVLLIFLACPVCVFAQQNKANEFMGAGNYSEAASILESIRSKGIADKDALINLAYCYIMLHDYARAEDVYSEVEKDVKTEPTQNFYYGELLLINGKYSEARTQFTKYLEKVPGDFKAQVRLQSCDSVAKWKNHSTGITIENAGDINTPLEELWPVPDGDGLYFVSNNKELLADAGLSTIFTDPQVSFIFHRKSNQTEVFRPYSDSVSYIAFSMRNGRSAMVIKAVRKTPDGDRFGNSVLQFRDGDGVWKDFKPSETPDGYILTHPCFSENGNRIYFASDLPGGYGGSDLYYSDFSGAGWDKPVNLGEGINTPGNEMFPFITANGETLYFASDGHPGYGNLDIFSSANTGGSWNNPVNLRSPVNSIGNDFGLIFGDHPYRGYFVSNRYGSSKGGNDIYTFHFPEPVVKADTVPEVKYCPADTIYLFFRTSSTVIDPVFNSTMDSVADILKKYPYLNINVMTWADARGTEKFNTDLCTQRSQAVSWWYVFKGIDEGRIIKKPSGVSGIIQHKQIDYHVQLGYIDKSGKLEKVKKNFRNKVQTGSIAVGKGYCYYTGTGTVADMQALANQIKAKYKIRGSVIATYRNYYLGDYRYASCRRAEIFFTK